MPPRGGASGEEDDVEERWDDDAVVSLASAATRANKRELQQLLNAVPTLLDDEALGVRLETLEQLSQLAKVCSSTCSCEEVEEAVVNGLESQLLPAIAPAPSGSGAGGTSTLPMVRQAQLAALDSACGTLPPSTVQALLARLCRAADSALEKATGHAGGGGKAGGDAALMALSMLAVAVRHMPPERGLTAANSLATKLSANGDLRVREALAGVLPQLFGNFVQLQGALEQMCALFKKLCEDKVWSVQQACARVVPDVSELCNRAGGDVSMGGAAAASTSSSADAALSSRCDGLQRGVLEGEYLGRLLPAASQWVVTAARQVAGAAIAGLRPGLEADLLPRLLDAFCTASAAVGQGTVEVKRACAAGFADVLAKAGHDHWQQLQPVWSRLLRQADGATLCSAVGGAERVVRLLAAGPLGAAGAAQEVVGGQLMEVLRANLHAVAPALCEEMAGLLAVCTPELQRQVLEVLPALCEPPAVGSGRCGDWRPRLSLAQQLRAAVCAVAAPNASGSEAAVTVARCAVQLCGDPVWSVRQAAAAQVGLILGQASPPSDGMAAPGSSPAATALTEQQRSWLEKLPGAGRVEGLPGMGVEALRVLASWLGAAVGGTRAEASLAVTACCAAFAADSANVAA
ncbi:hypothetical protein HXX76_005261 [Chlamydomonas incerta]|uniref:TOG domain-containing protein n=1 Tax=Chlamydomonas incerta TaxID=51695 RepID=A0A835W465_CHLIN|nr:hypothetical protein HXX76_005261 [Chlamydomonas incerta]|eukprot:KAG2438715.1 hypothetical protein HXX76_005261 [Chlamydomonas incerta]